MYKRQVWDKINDTKADIQKVEATVQEAKAGIYKDISDAARGHPAKKSRPANNAAAGFSCLIMLIIKV